MNRREFFSWCIGGLTTLFVTPMVVVHALTQQKNQVLGPGVAGEVEPVAVDPIIELTVVVPDSTTPVSSRPTRVASVREGDEGYDVFLQSLKDRDYLNVFLDGEFIPRAIRADEAKGTVEHYPVDEDGYIQSLPTMEAYVRIDHGQVLILANSELPSYPELEKRVERLKMLDRYRPSSRTGFGKPRQKAVKVSSWNA